MRVALVYNPSAGNFCPHDIARLDAAFARHGAIVSRHDSLNYRLDEQATPPDLVCISGGDGTVRTVMCANAAVAHTATFCVHPSGTINLIAREAGYPRNPEDFARTMSKGRRARAHFGGQVNGLSFLCCATIGPDSRAVAAVSDRLKQRFGRLAYVMAFVRLLRRWPREVIDVTIDGDRRRGEGVMIFKARYYAGPFVLDRKADMASDRFRVLILPRARQTPPLWRRARAA